MKIKTLDEKPLTVFKREEILDLAEPVLQLKFDSENFKVKRLFLVSEHYEMRPDLISLAVYGSVDYVDLILKVNEIYNPFSIKKGDILLILDRESAKGFYKKIKQNPLAEFKKLYLDESRASKKDINRIKRLQEKAKRLKNGAKEIKPTNIKSENETTFTFEDGTISLNKDKTL